ncbi:hypothetical protein WN55_08551 [Dufourea novaeangliae]|uniref:Uncharacterized protein n=1 Tax=Dufourea novaeangliae TaxID=178035 RepID=A0A154P5G5_DUFNO|nr:hypothetical protein WN55_08551 [Dufourea novaeangliae]
MACEKATRKLRTILVKASRIGVPTTEVARLPTAKKLIPQRDHGWKLAVFLLLMLGGGMIVALACTARKGCTKLEEIGKNEMANETPFDTEEETNRNEEAGGTFSNESPCVNPITGGSTRGRVSPAISGNLNFKSCFRDYRVGRKRAGEREGNGVKSNGKKG